MKNYGAGLVGFGLGIATMFGFAVWRQRSSAVMVPAGTPYLFQGVTTVIAAPTSSAQLPIGATFVLTDPATGPHQYSVQADATYEVT